MSFAGKTIRLIEENPTGEYGRREGETVLIHFTDGTALKIEGSSYEEVSQSVEAIDRAEVNEWQRRAMGRREEERLQRLQRQEWLSISCEERGERKRAREAKMSPASLVMRDVFVGAIADQIVSANRMLYGDQPEQTIRYPCENCGERECENAPVKVIPARKAPDRPNFTGGFATIPLK